MWRRSEDARFMSEASFSIFLIRHFIFAVTSRKATIVTIWFKINEGIYVLQT